MLLAMFFLVFFFTLSVLLVIARYCIIFIIFVHIFNLKAWKMPFLLQLFRPVSIIPIHSRKCNSIKRMNAHATNNKKKIHVFLFQETPQDEQNKKKMVVAALLVPLPYIVLILLK